MGRGVARAESTRIKTCQEFTHDGSRRQRRVAPAHFRSLKFVITQPHLEWTLLALHVGVEILLIVRVLLRPNRAPASRIAWVAIIVALPVLGILSYLLFGEVNIGRRRVARLRGVIESLPNQAAARPADCDRHHARIPREHRDLFRLGYSVNGLEPVGGNAGRLLDSPRGFIDSLVEDIDAARHHVHLLFYIWLPDNNGCRVVEALQRAAARGVVCRVMVDDLGSKLLIRSPYWHAMQDAGVRLAIALRIGNPLLRMLRGRIDLRNHRKIVVIDDRITYCGSQNCADPEFRIKAKFAPWVDVMVRFEGPIARQNQHVFAGDWITYADENIAHMLEGPVAAPSRGFAAQVIATGPTRRFAAMSQVFQALIHSASRELVISTPYYVPDESMQDALCAAAYRGVSTTCIFPAKNDSWVVAGASRSYYSDLLQAGVQIYEYEGGLLHAKSLTLDGNVMLIGSANMDRRSFDLNYENNIMLVDEGLTLALRARQQAYIDASCRVELDDVLAWPVHRRLWNNTLATLGPVL